MGRGARWEAGPICRSRMFTSPPGLVQEKGCLNSAPPTHRFRNLPSKRHRHVIAVRQIALALLGSALLDVLVKAPSPDRYVAFRSGEPTPQPRHAVYGASLLVPLAVLPDGTEATRNPQSKPRPSG